MLAKFAREDGSPCSDHVAGGVGWLSLVVTMNRVLFGFDDGAWRVVFSMMVFVAELASVPWIKGEAFFGLLTSRDDVSATLQT
jgi:hypothetical protein